MSGIDPRFSGAFLISAYFIKMIAINES